jgi:hypothetical protein
MMHGRHSTKPRNCILLPEVASLHRQIFRHITLSPSAIMSSLVTRRSGMDLYVASIICVAFHAGQLTAGAIMVVEVGRHVSANGRSVSLVDEILEVGAHKRLHLIERQWIAILASGHQYLSRMCLSRIVDERLAERPDGSRNAMAVGNHLIE